jgi:hypothetical protein
MAYPTIPSYQVIGVAVTATITAYNSGTGDFSFTVSGTGYSANWPSDVIVNAINTIGRTVGSQGRLNLRVAKANTLRLTGWQSAGSSYSGVDYASYTQRSATVRTVSGNNVTIDIGGHNYVVDWSNSSEAWTGAETTITPVVGSAGVLRMGDAFGQSQGLGGNDKWPATLRLSGHVDVRVLRVGGLREVAVLDAAGAPVLDSRQAVATWQLPDAVLGFDPQDRQPQWLQLSHALKAQLAMP